MGMPSSQARMYPILPCWRFGVFGSFVFMRGLYVREPRRKRANRLMRRSPTSDSCAIRRQPRSPSGGMHRHARRRDQQGRSPHDHDLVLGIRAQPSIVVVPRASRHQARSRGSPGGAPFSASSPLCLLPATPGFAGRDLALERNRLRCRSDPDADPDQDARGPAGRSTCQPGLREGDPSYPQRAASRYSVIACASSGRLK